MHPNWNRRMAKIDLKHSFSCLHAAALTTKTNLLAQFIRQTGVRLSKQAQDTSLQSICHAWRSSSVTLHCRVPEYDFLEHVAIQCRPPNVRLDPENLKHEISICKFSGRPSPSFSDFTSQQHLDQCPKVVSFRPTWSVTPTRTSGLNGLRLLRLHLFMFAPGIQLPIMQSGAGSRRITLQHLIWP